MYPYTIAESPLRVSARLTVVHRGGIVLSVAICIKSKDLYTIRFCRIGVVCGPTHPERCELVCAAHAHPITQKKSRRCSEAVPEAAVDAVGLQPCDVIRTGAALRAVVVPLCAAVLDVFAHVFTSAYTGTGGIVLKVSMWGDIESLNILSPVHLFGGERHASII